MSPSPISNLPSSTAGGGAPHIPSSGGEAALPSSSTSDQEVLVRVDGVSKKFCRSLKKSLWYGVCDIFSELNPFGKNIAEDGRSKMEDRIAQSADSSGDSAADPSPISNLPSSTAEGGAPISNLQSPTAEGGDPISNIPSTSPPLRPGEFWAVNNVSFELRRGECLGLIGHNGAGKTTLLKMLNGLIKPDAGRIEMRGRIGALIALGAGFNPIYALLLFSDRKFKLLSS